MELFWYTLFLLIITILSQWILPEETPQAWLSKVIIMFGLIAISIIPIILINYIFSFFITSINSLFNDEVDISKQNQAHSTWPVLLIKIFYILISPAIIFAFIYGFVAFIYGLPDSLEDLVNFNYFVHSLTVSFPIPIKEVIYPNIAGGEICFNITSNYTKICRDMYIRLYY